MTTKVLIVDDSGFFRKLLTEIINKDPRLEVVATAANGQEALERFEQHYPDVISMDLEMPVMDGITAVRKIMAIRKTPVLMLSTWTTEGAKSTIEALEAGATDFLPKRFEEISRNKHEAHQKLCQRIYQIARDFHHKVAASQTAAIVPIPSASRSNHRHELIAIGTSTGGPVALQKVLMQLPQNYPHPILLIQHMPATFTPSFAERLNTLCKIEIKQAENDDVLLPGTAYLAPGGMQMQLKSRRQQLYLAIEKGAGNLTYKPSVDVTFNSIAQICGNNTLAIILTGMGADGCAGCDNIKQAGGEIWSQDQQSSTIYGMPMAVAKAGLSDRILDLNEIGRLLAEQI